MRTDYRKAPPVLLLVTLVLLVPATGCQAEGARIKTVSDTAADLTVGAKQYPKDDAVILLWHQHWTIDKDGSVHRRDHRMMKLFNHRPIRAHGDPRVDYNKDTDKVIYHTARTILEDGKILPVPEYSFNVAAPDDVAGYPEYIGWEQTVVSYSGIDDNCILDLDYEVITEPGVQPWTSAHIRISNDYPIVERVVKLTLPDSMKLHHRVEGINRGVDAEVDTTGNTTTYTWTFKDLPGDRGEPQSLSWQKRSARMMFSTCESPQLWVKTIVDAVDKGGRPDSYIKEYVKATIEHETDPARQVHLISDDLHATFNLVSSHKTMRSFNVRPAAEVLRCNYGSPLEAAALEAAAFRALGLTVSIRAAIDATAYGKTFTDPPAESLFAGVVVVVDTPDGEIYVYPGHGVFTNPGGWGRHLLVGIDGAGRLDETYIQARGETEPSNINITGKITVDDEGKAAGDLRIRLTGAFYDPANLESASSQKSLVSGITGRLLSGFELESHSIGTLSETTLRASAAVTADEPKKLNGRYVLRLGDGPVFPMTFAMPLDRSYRSTDVHLGGAFRENVDLTFELPEGWSTPIVPASLAAVDGAWGRISQSVDVDGTTIRLRRAIEINSDTISPEDFAVIRRAVTNLQSDGNLMIALGE